MTVGSASRNSSNPTPAHELLTLVLGAAMGQVVAVAAELGIADLLADGPRTVEQIATATETNPRALTSIMRTLVSLGVFQQTETGAF